MSGHGATVGGDVLGHLVVGDHNVVIHARDSSTVSVRDTPPPPTRRRSPVASATPRSSVELLGRDTELTTIGRWLDQREPVDVHGEPGIGKTALLRRISSDRAAGKSVVFLPAAGLSRDDLYQEIFQAFYDAEGYRPEPARLRRLLGSVEATLVLDDFDSSSDDLAAILDTIPACDVLLSGPRRRLIGEGRDLHLGGLDEESARAVITRHLGRRLTSAEQAEATRVWEAAGGNPGVLVRTAAAVRAARDADPEGDLPLLTLDMSESALGPVLARRLGDDARRVLATLATFGGKAVPRQALAAASGASEAGVTELADAGLLEEAETLCRLSGSLAHAVAREVGEGPSPASVAQALTTWVRAAGHREVAGAAPALLHLLDRALADGTPGAALPLARAAAPKVALSLRWDAWSQVLTRGRDIARAAKSAADEAYFAHERGVLERVLGALATVAVGAAGGTAGAAVLQHLTAPAVTQTAPAALPPPRPPTSALAHSGAAKSAAVIVVAAATAGGIMFTTQNKTQPVSHPPPVVVPTTHVSPPPPPTTFITTFPTTSVTTPPSTPPPLPEPGKACDPSPDVYSFYDVPPEGSSQPQLLTLDSACSYNRQKFSVDGPDAPLFEIDLASCPASGNVPGDRCQIKIAFKQPAPPAPASRTYQAHLTLPQADGSVGIDDTLQGFPATASPTARQTTTTDPACPPEPVEEVAFPRTPASSSTTASYYFQPINCPGVEYRMDSVSTDPVDVFSVSPSSACPSTVEGGGGGCTLTLTYHPSEGNISHHGYMVIRRNDRQERVVQLTGQVDGGSTSTQPNPSTSVVTVQPTLPPGG